jgi:hypothetical protein
MINWFKINMEPGHAPEFPLDFHIGEYKEPGISINKNFEIIELKILEDYYVYVPIIDGAGKEDIDKAKKILEDEAKRRKYKNLNREDRCVCLHYDYMDETFGAAILPG